eukprot:jgi/Bigna1/66067/fgenesh1_pg.1_\
MYQAEESLRLEGEGGVGEEKLLRTSAINKNCNKSENRACDGDILQQQASNDTTKEQQEVENMAALFDDKEEDADLQQHLHEEGRGDDGDVQPPWRSKGTMHHIRDTMRQLWGLMLSRKLPPTPSVHASSLIVQGVNGEVDKALRIERLMTEKGHWPPSHMAEDMFKVLWRCRRDKFLRDITDRNTLGKAPLEKTEETFGELIKRRGSMNYMDTLWWLERLKDQGIKPGLATYRVVLERLSHADNLNRKAAYKAAWDRTRQRMFLPAIHFLSSACSMQSNDSSSEMEEFMHFAQLRLDRFKKGEIDLHMFRYPARTRVMSPLLCVRHVATFLEHYWQSVDEQGDDAVPTSGLILITGVGRHSFYSPGVNRELVEVTLRYLGLHFVSTNRGGALRISKTVKKKKDQRQYDIAGSLCETHRSFLKHAVTALRSTQTDIYLLYSIQIRLDIR